MSETHLSEIRNLRKELSFLTNNNLALGRQIEDLQSQNSILSASSSGNQRAESSENSRLRSEKEEVSERASEPALRQNGVGVNSAVPLTRSAQLIRNAADVAANSELRVRSAVSAAAGVQAATTISEREHFKAGEGVRERGSERAK